MWFDPWLSTLGGLRILELRERRELTDLAELRRATLPAGSFIAPQLVCLFTYDADGNFLLAGELAIPDQISRPHPVYISN